MNYMDVIHPYNGVLFSNKKMSFQATKRHGGTLTYIAQ
jgi:hypothetical protein